jgi:DNA-binding helix-hairpin-helix protein with protein kinase domain
MLDISEQVEVEQSETQGSVQELIGFGTQAEVYRCSIGHDDFALKWYYPAFATDLQRDTIENLVSQSAPSTAFLWPKAICSIAGKSGFGYLMDLRPDEFCGLSDIMKRQVDPDPTFYALLTASMSLADAYLKLHSAGLCYRDISFGNAFINPKSGAVLVCDNDNVTVEGQYQGGVKGTQRFMAPEVVMDVAPTSVDTDLHSLSVLLFCLLMIGHPLEGELETQIHAFDLPAMTQLYGQNPVFIFDPNDDSNRPVPGDHDNPPVYWNIYPAKLRELFTRTFTVGLHHPAKRVRESEWRSVLSRARDSIMYCLNCGAENFYERDSVQGGILCWSCRQRVVLPFRMKLDGGIVMLNHDTTLFSHHLGGKQSYNFETTAAEVTVNPRDTTKFGLKNLGHQRWMVTTQLGRNIEVEPGQSVGLASGLRINFGSTTGEITL